MPKPTRPVLIRKDKPTSMMIPPHIHVQLKAEAKRQDRTVSSLLRRIIQDWFEAFGKGKVPGEPKS